MSLIDPCYEPIIQEPYNNNQLLKTYVIKYKQSRSNINYHATFCSHSPISQKQTAFDYSRITCNVIVE